MKTSITRAELRDAAVSCAIVVVNEHNVRVLSISQTTGGKERFTVDIDGQKYESARFQKIQKLVDIETSKRTSTIVPKSQRAEKTASNIDKTVTRRYSFKGLSVEDTQKIAFLRVDELRTEQRRIEREINLLLTFTRDECIENERKILQARETAANNRKHDVQARVKRLQSYIDTYAKRVGDIMLSGDIERAQLLVATQANRLARAQALISVLNNM